MKTYVLMISRTFPATHKLKGEETYFEYCIKSALGIEPILPNSNIFEPKIHTIRANYDLWEKRIKKVQEGEAILSLRYWSDKPYKSKQVEFCRLDKDSGVGVQVLEWKRIPLTLPPGVVRDCIKIEGKMFVDIANILINNFTRLAKNDGLSLKNFKEWFKKYDISEPMAIIHFTKFRY